ncbi:ABC transporter substrate-binding protein [Salinicola acroporae]|uniref:ABC transporter substrate-binding protein n=1 Tax=Salinicola acroporae TaxID=1541440 RepID=A0ABT6I7T2_9GAMM|nr:ABC transporter substrate-binding protein [Salinicola acroporae]MDH4573772.1 ABC transporter substrate-binding protein [Salinicola acroporae]
MPRVRSFPALLALAIAVLLGMSTAQADAQADADSKPPRIAAANWTVVETLIALGVEPYAVSDIPNYNAWVKAPAVPDSTLDMGLRNEPNLELLAQDPPDLLMTSALFSRDNARLERLMPVRMIDNFYTDRPYYEATLAMTREIARLTGRQPQAEALIAETDAVLAHAARALRGAKTPLYLVQFSDAQHVRVFGQGNMVGTLFSRTGLTNAWAGPTNAWGYASIPIDRLAERPEARIVVIKPYPRGVEEALGNNQIWRHLPAVRAGRVSFIDPVWPYGGLVSLQRLARSLVDVATADTSRASSVEDQVP